MAAGLVEEDPAAPARQHHGNLPARRRARSQLDQCPSGGRSGHGLGGIAAPFIGIKAIDMILTAFHIFT